MPEAEFRFYAELNDFLPRCYRQKSFSVHFDENASVKHVVEALGVPHTEIDLILVGGETVDFRYHLRQGDQVSVYPVFESLDIAALVRLRPRPLREPRFVLDTHLGRLAAYLRMLGFDTIYHNYFEDQEIAEISSREKRLLLTRDRGLLKRNVVTHGYCVRKERPYQQLLEVVNKFDLFDAIHPFQRCMVCNEKLVAIDKQKVAGCIPPEASRIYSEFVHCPGCKKVYWKGSHYERMKKVLEALEQERNRRGGEPVDQER